MKKRKNISFFRHIPSIILIIFGASLFIWGGQQLFEQGFGISKKYSHDGSSEPEGPIFFILIGLSAIGYGFFQINMNKRDSANNSEIDRR